MWNIREMFILNYIRHFTHCFKSHKKFVIHEFVDFMNNIDYRL